MQLCESPLTSIKLDPTQLILVSCHNTQQIFGVSLIDKKYEYVYLNLATDKFATVELDHEIQKEHLLKKSKGQAKC